MFVPLASFGVRGLGSFLDKILQSFLLLLERLSNAISLFLSFRRIRIYIFPISEAIKRDFSLTFVTLQNLVDGPPAKVALEAETDKVESNIRIYIEGNTMLNKTNSNRKTIRPRPRNQRNS